MSSYTKSGFSKSFVCCSRFEFCDYGKKKCWYEDIDPETTESCGAWQRHNLPSKAHQRKPLFEEPIVQMESLELDIEKERPGFQGEPLELDIAFEAKVQVKEQLTLF